MSDRNWKKVRLSPFPPAFPLFRLSTVSTWESCLRAEKESESV
jgi:hypothetical protein